MSGTGLTVRGMRERARLAGAELDIHSGPGGGTAVRLAVPVPHVRGQLRVGCAATERPTSLVVDLTDVRFFSAAGLTQLLTVRQRCRERRLPLLVIAPDSVLRPLRLTDLGDLFDLVAPDRYPGRTRRGHVGPRQVRDLPTPCRAMGSPAPRLIDPCRRG